MSLDTNITTNENHQDMFSETFAELWKKRTLSDLQNAWDFYLTLHPIEKAMIRQNRPQNISDFSQFLSYVRQYKSFSGISDKITHIQLIQSIADEFAPLVKERRKTYLKRDWQRYTR